MDLITPRRFIAVFLILALLAGETGARNMAAMLGVPGGSPAALHPAFGPRGLASPTRGVPRLPAPVPSRASKAPKSKPAKRVRRSRERPASGAALRRYWRSVRQAVPEKAGEKAPFRFRNPFPRRPGGEASAALLPASRRRGESERGQGDRILIASARGQAAARLTPGSYPTPRFARTGRWEARPANLFSIDHAAVASAEASAAAAGERRDFWSRGYSEGDLRAFRDRFRSPAIDIARVTGLWRGQSPPPPVRRIRGRWRRGPDGLLYRVSYLNAVGLTILDRDGVHFHVPGRTKSKPADMVVPERHRGVYGVYLGGQRVEYEIEFINRGINTFRGLLVTGTQEGFNPSGGEGRWLSSHEVLARQSNPLAPGERLVLKSAFRLVAGRYFLQQTHLRVYGKDASGRLRELIDDPQAAIVDPPTGI
ncbi:MAG: hypothetical protein ABII00_19065 [Elusimicrobiota bacterium]